MKDNAFGKTIPLRQLHLQNNVSECEDGKQFSKEIYIYILSDRKCGLYVVGYLTCGVENYFISFQM